MSTTTTRTETTSLLSRDWEAPAAGRGDNQTESSNSNSTNHHESYSSTAFGPSYGATDRPDSVETVPNSDGGNGERESTEDNVEAGPNAQESNVQNEDGSNDAGVGQQQEGQNSGDDVEEEGSATGEGTDTRDGAIGSLTRRLRCLFSTITWPIVPLGTIVAIALLWVLYAASSLDLRKSCSHPLHWYALTSLVLVAYIPNHATVRSHLFHYSRERDGPIRPARVRMYDQFFHTVCLLYVYTGVTLIQTCREDLVNDADARQEMTENGNELAMPSDGPFNTCQVTCPNLYQALSVYVATLEMFTFALILPLLFLPCIYLWFLRRATAEAEAFAQLQDRLQEEEALLNNGGVTVGEILDGMETIKLVSRRNLDNAAADGTIETPHLGETEEASNSVKSETEGEIWLLPYSETDISIGMRCNVKECCICMVDFAVQNETDLEDGMFESEGNITTLDTLAGNDREVSSDSGHGSVRSETSSVTHIVKESVIIRTKCGHIFHQECLAGWIGGRWQLNPNAANNPNDDTTQDRRRRRARQTCCPLCREDLRPETSR